MAVIIDRISSLARILSMRAFSTFRILPRSGRMAWNERSRPCLADPPAESPSTRKSSQVAGSSMEQSASLPGRTALSRPVFLRTRSRALRAASRARAALAAFSMIPFATPGCSPRNSPRCWLMTCLTIPSTSLLPSLVLVCPSNCGSRTFTCRTQVSPSRMSSPERVKLAFLSCGLSLANSLIVRVRAERKPVRWVPPSWVLMLFTKVKTFSL